MEELCISQGSIKKLIVNESYGGGVIGNFGVKKTLETQI